MVQVESMEDQVYTNQICASDKHFSPCVEENLGMTMSVTVQTHCQDPHQQYQDSHQQCQTDSNTESLSKQDNPDHSKRDEKNHKVLFSDDLTELKYLDENVTELSFSVFFNQPIPVGAIPPGIKKINFGRDFNQPLPVGAIPPGTTHVVFGSHFNQLLAPGVFSEGLVELRFGNKFNSPLNPGVLPSSLKVLKLGLWFNRPLKPGVLPKCLEKLICSCHFNKSIGTHNLPPDLSELHLASYFNQLIDGFPPKLTHLSFGNDFWHPLFALPASLEVLKFTGNSCNVLWLPKTVLPSNLKEVVLCGNKYMLADLKDKDNLKLPAGCKLTLEPYL